MNSASKTGFRHLIFPVFLPMQGCPGTCIYCDQFRISGAGPEICHDPSPALEFLARHRGQPRQIAFYGGSFTALDESSRDALIAPYLADMDGLASFRISTHPLFIDPTVLDWCRDHRVVTIELGIQDWSDRVLSACGRGYGSDRAINAARMVRDWGFELGIQLMPGLPGWDEASLEYNRKVVNELRPPYLRLYPCLVLKGTPLEQLWRSGEFQPLSLEEAINQCADWQELCDAAGIAVIKLGLPSNLDPEEVAAGPWHPAFGQLVKAELLVRALAKTHGKGEIIKLDKKDWALIMAHGKLYYNILRDRIRNCSVERM